MQERTDKGFYARFLGGFALYYNDREILVGMGLRSKPAQCLLLLLKAGDEGVERKELLGLVKAVGNDQKRQLNNLYQHMHVLREMLPDLGLPEGRYIVLRKGRYYFTTDHRVGTDLGELDSLIGRLKSEGLTAGERLELCKAYCKSYGGELLPQLAGGMPGAWRSCAARSRRKGGTRRSWSWPGWPVSSTHMTAGSQGSGESAGLRAVQGG